MVGMAGTKANRSWCSRCQVVFHLLSWVCVQGSYFKLSRLIFSSQDAGKKEGDSLGDWNPLAWSWAKVTVSRTFSQDHQSTLLQGQWLSKVSSSKCRTSQILHVLSLMIFEKHLQTTVTLQPETIWLPVSSGIYRSFLKTLAHRMSPVLAFQLLVRMCVGDGQPWHWAQWTEGQVRLLCKARCFLQTAVNSQGRDRGLPERGVVCASMETGAWPKSLRLGSG